MKNAEKSVTAELKGAGFIAASSFFFGSYGIWSKLMSGVFSEFGQAWTRAVIILCILIPYGYFFQSFKKIEKQDIKWFLVIALCGGLNQAPYFYGFEHLSVGTATLLFYLSLTIGSYIIGKLFFSEELTITKYISLFLSCIGLYILYSFSLSNAQIFAALLTILAGLMGATYVVFTKKISNTYGETQILTACFIAMLLTNLLVSYFINDTLPDFATTQPWLAQLAYASSMLVANACVIAGFRLIKEPSVGGIIGLLEVIFGVIFGVVLFGEKLSPSTIIGFSLILAAIALPDLLNIAKKTLLKV